MKAKDRRLAELKQSVPEVTPQQAADLQSQGAVLIDVREPDEISQGSPVGAERVVRGFLELRIEDVVSDASKTVLVMCAGGVRSLFAAEGLQRMGYGDVRSVTGGFNRWKSDGLPVEVPPMLDAAQRERYSRHLLMPEIGEQGQLRLLDAKVLFIGAGGLGCPGLVYLAAAGVGTIGIVDDDVVERSNLQRQILHDDASVGESKVESAKRSLLRLNPSLTVRTHPVRLTSSNVEEILADYDIVVDGSDNFPTRYLVNDACVKLGLPNVHGSIYRFEGQVSVFWPGREQDPGPCYRCLYPEPPPPEMAPSCAEAGVLGVLPGIVGVMEAIETIKLVLGVGELLVGRLLHYDALRQRFSEFRVEPDPDCAYCGSGRAFPGYVDYEQFCSSSLSVETG
jgi:molybdopterin/thiamine biosynthesis adenylyltransferase/rhodanese-related sulfurtransferase